MQVVLWITKDAYLVRILVCTKSCVLIWFFCHAWASLLVLTFVFTSRCLHRWELDAALDVLTMCTCHLPEDNPIKNEVIAAIFPFVYPKCVYVNLLHLFSVYLMQFFDCLFKKKKNCCQIRHQHMQHVFTKPVAVYENELWTTTEPARLSRLCWELSQFKIFSSKRTALVRALEGWFTLQVWERSSLVRKLWKYVNCILAPQNRSYLHFVTHLKFSLHIIMLFLGLSFTKMSLKRSELSSINCSSDKITIWKVKVKEVWNRICLYIVLEVRFSNNLLF